MSGYKSEAEFADALNDTGILSNLAERNGWRLIEIAEMEGLAGRPDLVLCFIKTNSENRSRMVVLSIELKLSNWKRALQQAFRYRSFAHYSYVLIDQAHISAALKNLDRFERSNIGLMSFSPQTGLRVHTKPRFSAPYSRMLAEKLVSKVQVQSSKACH